jgi:hypothetical protein
MEEANMSGMRVPRLKGTGDFAMSVEPISSSCERERIS